MDNDNVVALAAPATDSDPLTDLLRSGARRLIEAAVSAEFEDHLAAFAGERLADGRRRVVRNGHLPPRQVLTGIGAVDVRVPKSRSREGSRATFRSSLVPPYVRRSASLSGFRCRSKEGAAPRTPGRRRYSRWGGRPLPAASRCAMMVLKRLRP